MAVGTVIVVLLIAVALAIGIFLAWRRQKETNRQLGQFENFSGRPIGIRGVGDVREHHGVTRPQAAHIVTEVDVLPAYEPAPGYTASKDPPVASGPQPVTIH